MNKQIVLKGKLYYAFLGRPDTSEEGKNRYTVCLGNLDAKSLETLSKENITPGQEKPENIGTPKDRGSFVRAATKYPPIVVDKNDQTMTPEELLKVGNGTDAMVIVTLKDTIKIGGRPVRPKYLDKVKILNLVKYEGSTKLDFPSEDAEW